MYFSSLLAVTALLTTVLCAAPQPDCSTKSEFCYTSLGPKKTKWVPTSTHTIYKTATKTVTKRLSTTKTVTPGPTTTTTTATVTSTTTVAGPTNTDTATITTTINTPTTITLPTVTITETDTVTNTNTASTTTTTISTMGTASGFLPIQTSLPGSSDSQNDPMQQRDLSYVAALKTRNILARGKSPACKKPPPSYPTKVSCDVYRTRTVTKTVTKTETCTKTGSKPTITSTVSSTSTSTVTTYPSDVTSTVTVSTTTIDTATISPITTTTTTTTTSTTTTSTTVVTQTAYAQCSAANIADQSPAGSFLSNVDSTTSYQQAVSDAATSLDCCALCAQTPNCAVYILIRGSTLGNCYLLTVNGCPTGPSSWTISNGLDQSTYAYGNGACGLINQQ